MGLNSAASGRLESAEQLVFMQDFVDLWLVHICSLGGAPPLLFLIPDIPLCSALFRFVASVCSVDNRRSQNISLFKDLRRELARLLGAD
jgi:hypothetical protein